LIGDLVFERQSPYEEVPPIQHGRESSGQEAPMDREGSSQQSRETIIFFNELYIQDQQNTTRVLPRSGPRQAQRVLAVTWPIESQNELQINIAQNPPSQYPTVLYPFQLDPESSVHIGPQSIDVQRLSLSYLLQTNNDLLRLARSIFRELTSSPNYVPLGNTHGSNLMSLTDNRIKETMEVETQTDYFLDYIAIQTESPPHLAIQSIKDQGSPPHLAMQSRQDPHPAIQSQNSIPSNTGPKNDTDKSLRKSNSENDIKSKQNDPSIQVAQSAIIGGITALGIGLIVSAPIVPLVVAIGVGFVVGGIIGHEMSFQAKNSQEREAKLGEFEKPPPQTSSKSGDPLVHSQKTYQ